MGAASDRLAAVLREVGVETAMKPATTLRSLLVHKRPAPALELGVVYRIPCEEGCSWKYVGETSRTKEERAREHRRAIKDLDVERSEVANHFALTGHRINLDGIEVLDRDCAWRKRIIKEAIWTKRTTSQNRVKFVLSDAWNFL